MSIEDEIIKVFNETDSKTKLLVKDSVNRMILLQSRLIDMETKPLIKYHPDDPSKQKVLPAYKVYISLLQQYNNLVFKLCSILIKTSNGGDNAVSPLRKYLENLNETK